MVSDLENNVERISRLLSFNRIRILELLLNDEACVCEMVKVLDIKHNLLSHHLKSLMDIGYIDAKRNGQHIIYALVPTKKDFIKDLFKIINSK